MQFVRQRHSNRIDFGKVHRKYGDLLIKRRSHDLAKLIFKRDKLLTHRRKLKIKKFNEREKTAEYKNAEKVTF